MTIRFDTPGHRYRDNKTFEFLDSDSLMYFYKKDTVTLLDTFKDGLLTAKNENPLPLDDDGTLPNVWLQDAKYDIFLDNGDSVQQLVRTIDGAVTIISREWDAFITYVTGDKVKASDDNWYISLAENIDDDPISNPQSWTRYRVVNIYNALETYEDGAIVEFTNFIYTSIQDGNIGNDPDSSPTFWQVPVNVVQPTDVAFGGVETKGSNGNLSVTGFGFQPSSVMVICFGQGDFSATLGYFGISAGVAPGRTTTGTTSNTGVCISSGIFWKTTRESEVLISDSLLWRAVSPATPTRGTTGELVSLDADGCTFNYTDFETAGSKIYYVGFK